MSTALFCAFFLNMGASASAVVSVSGSLTLSDPTGFLILTA
jgi:hypothetical protein